MCFGIHVRIDPNGHRRCFPEGTGTLVDEFQFLQGFHVEHQNALFERKVDFINPFSHTRIDHAVRSEPGLEPPEQLSPGNDVQPAAEIGKEFQNGHVRIGFCRKAHQPLHTFEGFVKRQKVAFQRGMAVKVKRRAHLVRNFAYGHILAIKFILLVVEVVHGIVSWFLVVSICAFS